MCEANVYINRSGNEELLMEKVDRVVPGPDDMIILESIFGERKVVKARIREMELVHHRIMLDEVVEDTPRKEQEIWLEPETDHGHFHPGDEVVLKLRKGYNMQAADHVHFTGPEAFIVKNSGTETAHLHEHHGSLEIGLGQEAEGLLTVYAHEKADKELWAKVIVEIGHHHHHGIEPAGLPLEIVPHSHSHVHLGDNYEIQVLKDGSPLEGVEVKATYTGSHKREYPYRMVTDEEGRARVFLSARGNWLFSVEDGGVISTFTLIKSF